MYPLTVPLIQLWGALGINSVDHHYILIPWLLASVAMGLALYGHLRLLGVSSLAATASCYLLLNMPYINVHVALAGYADIWMAAAFSLGALSLNQWVESRQRPYAAFAIVFAIMCTQLKIPGIIMGGIILAVMLFSLIRTRVAPWRAPLAILLTAFLTILLLGVDFNLQGVGRVALSTNAITLPYIGQYEFSYHPVSEALFTTTFLMLNWNLLWYVFPACLALAFFRKRHGDKYLSILVMIAGALIFIAFVYYFTDRYRFALDYTQINRALIYVTPLMVFPIGIMLHNLLGDKK
jgi:hypothetical protein